MMEQLSIKDVLKEGWGRGLLLHCRLVLRAVVFITFV